MYRWSQLEPVMNNYSGPLECDHLDNLTTSMKRPFADHLLIPGTEMCDPPI